MSPALVMTITKHLLSLIRVRNEFTSICFVRVSGREVSSSLVPDSLPDTQYFEQVRSYMDR